MKSLNSQIIRLAIPSILANITIPLVGLVDIVIAGHIADAAAIGGIAIGTMLFDLLYWNFAFLRVGTSGITAQAYGRQDWGECAGQLRHALQIALIGAAGILLIQWAFVWVAFQLVPCSEAVAAQARTYFFIRVWAAPATLCLFAFKGWFIGMQDTVSPMVVDIVVNVVNMVVSYCLAVYTPLAISGVAYGTVIAQFTGFVLSVVFLVVKYPRFFKAIWHRLEHPIERTVHMNTNLFVRSLCFMVIYVGYTSLSSRYGDEALAVSSLIMKLFMMFSFFIDGFAYAGEALVGRIVGESQAGRFSSISGKSLVWVLHGWCIGIAILFTIVFGLWGTPIMHLLWPDVMTDWNYLPWLLAMPLISAPAFMWDGIYVGLTASKGIRDAMIASAVAFVAIYVVLMNRMGIEAVLYAYFAHLVARDVYLTLLWKKYDRAFSSSSVEGSQK